MEKCKYCYGDEDNRNILLNTKISEVYIDYDNNLCVYDIESDDCIKINYCPVCGRKLNKKE